MSDIEKIRQEIERRKDYISVPHFAEELDSLPEEKPSDDLDEAADKFEQEYFTDATIGEAFIEGAKWQKEQDKDWLNCELMKAHLNGVMTGDRIARESLPMPEDTVIFQRGVAEGRRLEREDGLAWQDIKSIVQIADKMLDDPKARVEFQNHNEEYYYKRVLDEYELHKTKEE